MQQQLGNQKTLGQIEHTEIPIKHILNYAQAGSSRQRQTGKNCHC